MDIHQLRTFVTVAREGSITRASEILHLSQPAVSAHIKAIEDSLGLSLFERSARGMSLTHDGRRLLEKAEQTLAAHQALLAEAARVKGRTAGKLVLGAGRNSSELSIARLIAQVSERLPELELSVQDGGSHQILERILRGELDAGCYNEPGEPPRELRAHELSRFGVCVAAAPGLVAPAQKRDFRALAELPWIFPTASSCCGTAAKALFEAQQIRPARIIDVDRESMTRSLVESGAGVGLLHRETATLAQAEGELEVLYETPTVVRVLFAYLASRAQDPRLASVVSLLTTDPA